MRVNASERLSGGYALLLVLFFSAVGLLGVTAMLQWSSQNAHLIQRNNEYQSTVAAAEAATEKVLTHVSTDFQNEGEALVYGSVPRYRTAIPSTDEDSSWSDWRFSAGPGEEGLNFVDRATAWSYVDLQSQYKGLRGMASTYRVVSNAQKVNSDNRITVAVRQEFQIANVPVFQFTIFYSLPMEISCGQPFNVIGRVHSNQDIYVCPDSALTFLSDVTAVGNIYFSRAPGDNRGAPAGSVSYQGQQDARVAALSLPIGTNNTPEAVHAILETPPATEDPNSPLGKQRYYNKADLLLIVGNNTVTAKSGLFSNFAFTIPNAEVANFVTTNASFLDP